MALKKLRNEDIPKVGVLSAGFFVAGLIHVPIGFASVHLVLNGLVGIILGWLSFPAIFVGLLLQSIMFQYGGITALGVNTFFDGYNGETIAVRDELANNPRGLAASANGLAGNGDVAGAIAQLAIEGVDALNGLNLADNFHSMVGRLASDARAAQDNYIAADVVVQTLEAERQSISGVSVDEEAVKMIIYQRAFQGAARYVALIDEMLQEVIALGG